MSISEKKINGKLEQFGTRMSFKVKSNYIVRPYIDSWRFIVLDHVWLTTHPVEVPVVGFEITTKGKDFANTKKMKGDIVNLQLLQPRVGILVVNEKEAEQQLEGWYAEANSYKEFLKTIASPIKLEILSVEDIMEDKVPWRPMLKKYGLKVPF